MSQILRQSTSKKVRIGPFVAVGDGFTPISAGLTLAGADQAEILKVNGTATVTAAGAFAAVTGCAGWYDYTLASGDVSLVGDLTIVVQDASVCLPVVARFQVVEEVIYDALYASGSASLPAIAPGSAGGLFRAGANTATSISTTGLTATLTGNLTGSVNSVATAVTLPSIPANWITAAGINADAITEAKIADNALANEHFAAAALTSAEITSAAGVTLAADQAVNATKLGGATVTATTSVTFPPTSTVATTTGAVGSVSGNVVGNIEGNIEGFVESLGATAKGDVNTEVDNALNVTTYTEPGIGAPGVNVSLVDKIGYLYKNWRNKKTQTATTWTLRDDGDTANDQQATVSDSAGTATKTEIT